MTVINNPELDALQALLESEGWRLLTAFYEKEWGTAAFGAKVSAAVDRVSNTTEAMLAAQLVQQTTVALKAVQGLKEWPAQRIQQLKRQAAPVIENPSRRGPGL